MVKLGILYFSSTGNSLYIAKKIKEQLGGTILYIPTYSGNGNEFDKLMIVTPIYSFGMPTPVFDLLPRLEKGIEIIAIQNYGGMVGGADKLLYDYALKCGLNIKSVYTMRMPENYTLLMSPPSFFKNLVLKNADKRIGAIITAYRRQKYAIPKAKHTKEKTYFKNKGNWHLIGGRFSVTTACIECKKCISICPANNIGFTDGKIVFGDRCIACLGCFHRCPQRAIIYNNKDNKKRYVNPNIDETEIGKNFEP